MTDTVDIKDLLRNITEPSYDRKMLLTEKSKNMKSKAALWRLWALRNLPGEGDQVTEDTRKMIV